ncbi:MAG: hypothetical protein CVV02_00165 [Firmicutes bacterium HGW-Firmicutes-7]|nr:MAG: hypothetical protein CVV02_00165 [Firmicutes bacterium HGW-Firmicutes-7]
MENTTLEHKQLDIARIKSNLREGLKTGLFAFVVCYLLSFVLALLLNFTAMSFVKTTMIGAMGGSGSSGFGTLIKLTSIIMSVSVFNSHGAIRIGMMLFAILPFSTFFAVGNKERVGRGFNAWNLLLYFITSGVFTVVLTLLQLVTRGDFLDINVSFISFQNLLTTLFVTVLIQLIIGLNYNKKPRSYIRATRVLFRLVLGLGLFFALIDLIKVVIHIPVSILGKVGIVLGLLPNVTVYKSFLFMGNNIETSESLAQWMDKAASMNISFEGLNLFMSIAAIIIWILMVLFSLLYINKNKYWKEMCLFAIAFSSISTFLAFCTSTSLGTVILVGEIFIGINMLQAFFVPLLSILALGLMVWLIRKMVYIVKEI